MKKLKFFAAVIIPSLLFLHTALGYGNAGHQAVGTIAAHYLEGSRAAAEVKALLHPAEDLARAATWADRAKIPDKYLTKEMKAFIANNPGHHTYHYCDIPFQQKAYRDGLIGTNDRDIVHILRLCIAILQKPDDLSDNPLKINKRIALLLVTHLTGDLHQPLHVGCSYVDEKDQFVDPATGAKGQEDAGANNFRISARTSLHGYWDTQTVKMARDQAGSADFTSYLIEHFPARKDWDATGAIGTWPEQWATDTLSLSKDCFDGIKLGKRFTVPKADRKDEHFEWPVTMEPEYAEKSRDIVEVELSKAGYRLAVLLKAIWPDK